MHIKLRQQQCNVQIPKNLTTWQDSNRGAVGGRYDHYATPPEASFLKLA
jgi:hypothetical protein